MLHCRDPKCGFLTYKCPECSSTKTVPLACKSRICLQCGKSMLINGLTNWFSGLFVVSYRYMVFTMSKELCVLFEVDHGLFKVFMGAVSNTVQ